MACSKEMSEELNGDNLLFSKIEELESKCKILENQVEGHGKGTDVCSSCLRATQLLKNAAVQEILNQPENRVLISSTESPKELLDCVENIAQLVAKQKIEQDGRREKYEIIGLKSENVRLTSQMRCMNRKIQYLIDHIDNLEVVIAKLMQLEPICTNLSLTEKSLVSKILSNRR
jgi:hypothetical protein